MDDASILILGANGQLGTALQRKYPGARSTDVAELDITNAESVASFDWSGIKLVLNAAAYTNVDGAEKAGNQKAAWLVNDTAVGYIAEAAQQHDLTLVHISTDYVFDGTKNPHTEDEPFSPLSIYGQSKAAGDRLVSALPKYYLLRTSWVIGEGQNFVRTMLELGAKGVAPTVVSDQIGRLTFTDELVRAIDHLLTTHAPYGTYNMTNGGEPASWADITREIFKLAGYNLTVTNTTTAEYYADKPEAAPRPLNSIMDLTKLQNAGFTPRDWHDDLANYVKGAKA